MNLPLLAITLFLLPFATSQSWSQWGLTDWEQIHQTLHLYPICIDNKDWPCLARVFTPTAHVDYNDVLPSQSGLAQIQAGIKAGLDPFVTQHLFGTTLIGINEDGVTANSTSYAQATHFGVPVRPNNAAIFYVKYVDSLVKTGDGWRVDLRMFSFMGTVTGNASLVGL